MGFADWAVDRLLHLPPPTTRHYDVEYGLRIPLPDGIVLLADRYRPVRTGPQPVVLVRTPYGRDFLTGRVFGAALARRGFQTVLQSVRGTSGSGGQFRGQHQERDDGVATVAWLRAQPWCDGRIAMVGGSYPGYAQWAVAPYVEPPLAAICPGVTTSGVEDQCGDVFALRGTLSWVARLDRQASLRLGGLLPDRRHAERMARAMTHLPMRTADVVAVGHELPLWRELLANVADVGHWAPADHSAALGRVRTPVSMVTGWYDHHLPWQLRDFRAIGDTGVPARITIGPWGHGDLATTAAMASDQLSWLATHLDGVPTETRAPVRVFLQHADRWLDLPAWPPESVPTPLYFAAGGRLTWTAPPAGAPAQLHYDPADPTPDAPPRQDARAVEARADILVYTGEPLTRALDILGDVRAVLPVRLVTVSVDLVVRLCDVDPAGVSRPVCDGVMRVRSDDDATVSLVPTGYRFLAGHRLRVHVARGAFPRYARDFGTTEAIADAHGLAPSRCVLPHEQRCPPHLVLPLFESNSP